MFLNFSLSGFYKTTVSKCFIIPVVAASTFVNVFSVSHRNLFKYDFNVIFDRGMVHKLFAAKLVFAEASDFLMGCCMIFYFRVFERRYGSMKYLTSVLWSFLMSTLFEFLTVKALSFFGKEVQILPSGPFFLIYPYFVAYYSEIPRMPLSDVLGISLSRKYLLYLLGLSMATTSRGSTIVAICGMLAGILYHWGPLQRIPIIPSGIADTVSGFLGPLLSSGPPDDLQEPIGATLDIQRQELLDKYEQALVNRRRNQILSRNRRRNYVPLPQEVQNLTDMGFAEDRSRIALAATNGNVFEAINLLQDPTFNPNS